jgi:hypothetical protein
MCQGGYIFVFLSVKGGVLISFQTSRERWRRSPQETPFWTASTTSWWTRLQYPVYWPVNIPHGGVLMASCWTRLLPQVYLHVNILHWGVLIIIQGGVFMARLGGGGRDRWRCSSRETPFWTDLTTSWWTRLLCLVYLWVNMLKGYIYKCRYL